VRTTNEIVNHLARYFVSNKTEINKEPLPPKVVELVGQLDDFLGNRLRENPPFREVWDGFVNDPEVYATFLVVALESIFNTDRTVHQRVDHLLEKIRITGFRTSSDELNLLDIDTDSQYGDFGWTSDVDNHSIVLIGNQRDQFPKINNLNGGKALTDGSSSALMIRRNSEIVNLPIQETKLPFMFMSLGQLLDSSDDLSFDDKLEIEEHLNIIWAQLTGNSPFDEKILTKEIDGIKQIDSMFADALVDALQSHIDDLPDGSREFIKEFRK
jgi:hypothetical protein